MYQAVTAMDARGNLTQTELANAQLRQVTDFYDNTGQMRAIEVSRAGQTLHHISYDTYDIFGNLKLKTQRYGAQSTSEAFEYDDLHRLTKSSRAGVTEQQIDYHYDGLGNLLYKSDYAQSYTYTGTGNCGLKPNAVCSVTKLDGSSATFTYDNNGNLLSGDGKTATYNVDNMPATLAAGGTHSSFYYGADGARFKQQITGTGGERSIYYFDKLAERIVVGAQRKTRYYLGDLAVLEVAASAGAMPQFKLNYLLKDRLGSVATLVDHNGLILERNGFDPFGKPREGSWEDKTPSTLASQITDRGFTGHEHLDSQQLIHMNGRVYDYNLGRFYSVDPYIQAPGNSQSINPYSYIMNNPLAGVDPTGYESVECNDNPCHANNVVPYSGYGGTRIGSDGRGRAASTPRSLSNGAGGAGKGAGRSNEKPSTQENVGAGGGSAQQGIAASSVAGTAPGGIVIGAGEGSALASGVQSKLGVVGTTLSLKGSSYEDPDDFIDVYRGTNFQSEIDVHEETGMIMSDAARRHYLESTMGGELTAKIRMHAVGEAGVAAMERHAVLVAKYGGEENLARAQTLMGTEFPDKPRSMFSVTTDINIAREKFAGPNGAVFHARVNKHKLIKSPVETSTESEYFYRAQRRMERIE